MEWAFWIFVVSVVVLVYVMNRRERRLEEELFEELERPTTNPWEVSIKQGMWLKPAIVDSNIATKEKRCKHRPRKLDGYEEQVVQLLECWYSQKKIGELLGVSQPTISRYLKHKGIVIKKREELDYKEYQKVAKERWIM